MVQECSFLSWAWKVENCLRGLVGWAVQGAGWQAKVWPAGGVAGQVTGRSFLVLAQFVILLERVL